MATIYTRAGKGSALTWTEGDANVTNLNTAKIENVVEDTTPQLGGNLDVNGNSIVSVSNANIVIEPNGTGDVHLVTDALRIGDLNAEARISTYGTGDLVLTTNEGNDPDPSITIGNGANANITIAPTGTGYIILDGLNWPTADGTADYVLKTNGSGTLSWVAQPSAGATTLDGLSDVVITAAATNDVLVYDGTNWVDTAANTLTVSAASTATTATNATNVTIGSTDGNTADTTTYVALAASLATGNQQLHLDGGLVYNASTNAFTSLTSSTSLNFNTGDSANNISATINSAQMTLGNSTASATKGRILIYNNSAGALDGLIIGGSFPLAGSFTTLSANTSVSFSPSGAITLNPTTAGTINNMSIGATTASTGAFTTLTASGAVTLSPASAAVAISPTGTGTVAISPAGALTINPTTASTINNTSIGATTASTGRFTTVTSTIATGTAPFTVASTTNVANLNASSLNGATFASPGAIGGTTKAAGTFTTMTADTAVLDDIRETVFSGGTTTGTITPDAANGSVQTLTLTGNITLNAFSNPVSGQTITFVITQSASGNNTLTSTMKFAGGSKTLSTAANAIDVLTVSYIGTTYYASLSKAFA